ncbi:FimV/HubP family polar landmark protein [Amphritea sp. HPY]|uniref:FimV/HubP family polar landmark protein n=1 Tax=Amphritea sp. HPY TaxID=3421652 RepID=UPI003D7E7708
MLRKLALSLAIAGALGISNANALGLGEIRIKSALNEPLQAEIQLLQMRELDPQQVQPRMANIDEFALAGIEKLRFLSDVHFEVKPGAAGRGTIIMTSSAPVKEPFLNFLVEVNWPSGRLVREYTVLLDPPVYDPTPRTTAVQPAQSQSVATPSTITAQPLSASAPLDNIKTRVNPQSQIYVDVNDTLWNLAKKYKPAANITEAQMMLALQRKNPSAFANNNVNQLKAGVVLDIPTLDEARELTQKQANEEFWRQTGVWKQGAVATQPKGAQLDASAGKEQASEKKGSEVASSSAQGQLKIVSAAQQKDAESGAVTDQAADTEVTKENAALLEKNQQLETELASALETVDMIQRENEEIAGRVDSLAEQMTSLQRLLEIKDNQIAELQAELDAAKKQPLVTPPAQQSQKKGLLEEFGIYIAGAAAAVVALLVALLFFVMGRRRKQDKEETEAADSEEIAALVDLPEEIEEDVAEELVADTDEGVSEVEPEEIEVDELSDLVDEDLDDLSDLDLDLEMDLEEVAPGVDDVIDAEEFDLGLEDDVSEIDQSVADETLESTDDEQIDDALDSILGEDAESLDLNEVSEVDDIEDLLSSVESAESVNEEELDDELAFDIQPLNDDVVDSVVEDDSLADLSDEAELDFNLEADLEVEPEEELAGEIEEVADATTLPEIEDEPEELPDLDELFGGDLEVTETLDNEDGSLVDSEDELADLDDLLGGAVDTVEEAGSEAAEVDEISDLDELLGTDQESDLDLSVEDEIADLDELLGGSEEIAAEADQPVLADDNELHPELEQLLDGVADDVVLEELDISAEPDSMNDLEASISHDLDAELDSELEDLLSGAGDSDISLSEDDGVDDGSFDGLNLLEGADEVETKLDLARAYIDMEDLDGAKDILQEIIKEGSDTQQQEANTLIDSLTN